MNWAAIIWLLLVVGFLIAEAATVTVISLWFAAGALAAMATALLGGGVWLQTGVFLVVSAIALTALRPLVRKYLTPKLTATNVDSVIGSVGIVTTVIDNVAAAGQVKLNGMEWTARSCTGELCRSGVHPLLLLCLRLHRPHFAVKVTPSSTLWVASAAQSVCLPVQL